MEVSRAESRNEFPVLTDNSCRRANNQLNIFEGVLQNPCFVFIQVVTLGGQLAIIFVGGEAFQTVPLTGTQWGWSMLFGFVTVPLGVLLRLVADEPVRNTWLFATAPLRRISRFRRKTTGSPEAGGSRRWYRRAGAKLCRCYWI